MHKVPTKGERVFLCAFAAAFFTSFFFAIAVPLSARAAFGISPPVINADHLVPGARFSQTVYLVQDHPDQDLPIAATLNLPSAVASWISLDQGTSFVIPKDMRQFPVRIAIDVPKGINLGTWTGKIDFITNPKQAGQVTIALGVQAIMNLRVGDDIYEKFSVPLIKLLDVEEGWDPRVYVKMQNEGNVPEEFTSATYELLDQFGGVRLAYSQKAGDFPETPPFSAKEYFIDFPMDFHLGRGQYWGNVSFYKNDVLVASQKTVFNVLERGALAASSLAAVQNYVAHNPVASAGGVAFVALATFIARVARSRRRKRA